MPRIVLVIIALLVAAFGLLRGGKRKEAEEYMPIPEITETGGITGDNHSESSPLRYSCCEENIEADMPAKKDVDVSIKNSPPNWVVVAQIPINVKFACQSTPGSKCYGGFQSVTVRANPRLGNAGPVSESLHWTSVRADCDGNKYEGKVWLFYIAAYAKPAGNNAFTGQLELDLDYGGVKGKKQRMRISLKAVAAANPPGAPEIDKVEKVKLPVPA